MTRYESEVVQDARTQGREDAVNAFEVGEPVPSVAELVADPGIRRLIQDSLIQPISAAALEAAVKAWADAWHARAKYLNKQFG